MKKISELFEGKQLDIQEETLNYISAGELKKYLEIADKFISDDAKTIINYLIQHNADYVNDLGDGDASVNALQTFYSKQRPKDEEKRAVYNALTNLSKDDRLLEVPVFQTDEQFHGILDKKISPDDVLLDLVTERGRSAVVKRFDKLVHKIANQFVNKSRLTHEELLEAAYHGLVDAMNSYGKSIRGIETEEDMKKRRGYTFAQYAAYNIRNRILGDIKELSKIVREPISYQQRERKEKGANTVTNTVSGDNKINTGSSKSEGNEKTLFDLIGDTSSSTRSIDQEDLDKLWADVFRMLEEHFDKKTMDIWYSYTGLNGYKKLKNKEIAAKYNVVPSNVTYYCRQVNEYIQKNKTLFGKMSDIRDLMSECLREWDDDNYDESRRINLNENIQDDDE